MCQVGSRVWAWTSGFGPVSVPAPFVHNDSPQWRTLTAKDFATMRRKVVIDGRRILVRGPLKGVELSVLGG